MDGRILVTGGAGYIGSHTAMMLRERGYEVVIYDNLSAGHDWASEGSELVIGDLNDRELLRKTMEDFGVDVVVHFAASINVGESVSDPAKYYHNNCVNGLNLLEAMNDAGVGKIVFSSSCATYGVPTKIPITEDEKQWPINPYGWTKLFFERMLFDFDTAYGMKSVCLRYFNAAGADPGSRIGEAHSPETHVIPILLDVAAGDRPGFTIFGDDYDTIDGTCIRDYVHVNDLADAHVKAIDYLRSGGSSECFNLGTGEGASIRDLIIQVQKVTGKYITVTVGPRREGDPAKLVADNSKAERILGWKPQCSDLGNIVRTAWNWRCSR